LAKKFDKISPKNISEEKFNQLVEALPSSVIEQSKAAVIPLNKKEKLNNSLVIDHKELKNNKYSLIKKCSNKTFIKNKLNNVVSKTENTSTNNIKHKPRSTP
jgi:hypothetical protein